MERLLAAVAAVAPNQLIMDGEVNMFLAAAADVLSELVVIMEQKLRVHQHL